MQKLRNNARPFTIAILLLAFVMGSPLVANEGEQAISPWATCLMLRDTGEKCTFWGSISWYFLNCENILVDPGPPCAG